MSAGTASLPVSHAVVCTVGRVNRAECYSPSPSLLYCGIHLHWEHVEHGLFHDLFETLPKRVEGAACGIGGACDCHKSI